MRLALIACTALALAVPLSVAEAATPQAEVARIENSPGYRKAVSVLTAEHARTVEDIVRLTEIPAPPFGEASRAAAYQRDLEALGLVDVKMDAEGNVTGIRPGLKTRGKGPFVAVAAHLDTVFPEGTDVKVRRQGWRLAAPGIGDNTRSLATLLAWVRALDAAGVQTDADLLIVGNVGEEGVGDLRGMKALFQRGPYVGRISAIFSVDGSDPSGVVTAGVGSRRYHVVFSGPGGHSYGAFGIVNPMVAMAGAVTGLYTVKPPQTPRTTYSASVTGGGTSVNAIPASVFVDVDLRSEDAGALADLDRQFRASVESAVAAENAARSTAFGPIKAEMKLIGERPAGKTPSDSRLVRITQAAITARGFDPSEEASSTDANIPMSLGIPAVTIGAGGRGGRAHAPDEWIDVEPVEMVRGMSVGLLAILATAGLR